MKPDEEYSIRNAPPTLPAKHGKVVQPVHQVQPASTPAQPDPSVQMLMQKIDSLYSQEPNAKEEIAGIPQAKRARSKHEQYMYDLNHSGKSLAYIQTAWHNYYIALNDQEKHEVWQEFYAHHNRQKQPQQHVASHPQTQSHHGSPHTVSDPRSAAEVRQELLQHVAKPRRRKKSSHAHSLAFGLSMGVIVLCFMLFGFFNERFVAPFITPSRSVSNTPIVIDPTTVAVGPESKIIIPKINLEIPVVYDEPSIEEHAVQRALERGIVHYATTSNPGEQGNGVVFGHSSNNILNKGKYKFAFVLLKQLEAGDTFMLQKDGKRYVYKVFDKKIVKPEDVSVLNATSKPATFSLITCDPPGTSLNRLVVIGEQITPDPSTNVASTAKKDQGKPAVLPSNAPTLWQRLTNWLSS